MSEPLLLVGQLLGIAFATGLNLYATVAVLGLALRFGWIHGMPPEIMGLSNALVIATADALYLVEFIADKVRYVDTLWDSVHTFIRPPAAALLAFAALSDVPPEIRVAATALAGLTALAAHGTKAGLRLAIHHRARGKVGPVVSVLEDAAAIALAVAALRYPATALLLAAFAIAIVALVGPRTWRAFHLGALALIARIRGFFGASGWREYDDFPGPLRALVEPPAIGEPPPKATRAAATGVRGVAAYRFGWLVLSKDGPVFLYRAFFRWRRAPLPPVENATPRSGILMDALELRGDRPATLFLLKDGPSAERVLAESTMVPT